MAERKSLFTFKQFVVLSLVGGLLWLAWGLIVTDASLSMLMGFTAFVSGILISAILLGLSMWLVRNVKWLGRK